MTSDGRWTLIRKHDNPVTNLEEYYEYEAKKGTQDPLSNRSGSMENGLIILTAYTLRTPKPSGPSSRGRSS